jgi:hypothetical protein
MCGCEPAAAGAEDCVVSRNTNFEVAKQRGIGGRFGSGGKPTVGMNRPFGITHCVADRRPHSLFTCKSFQSF